MPDTDGINKLGPDKHLAREVRTRHFLNIKNPLYFCMPVVTAIKRPAAYFPALARYDAKILQLGKNPVWSISVDLHKL